MDKPKKIDQPASYLHKNPSTAKRIAAVFHVSVPTVHARLRRMGKVYAVETSKGKGEPNKRGPKPLIYRVVA